MWSGDRDFLARGFLTPQPEWKKAHSVLMPRSERKRTSPSHKGDLFHVVHKVPAADSPYGRAKQVQLVEKDPTRAISLFWAAINAGDRVDSALKDMAVVMKQLDRSDEAIEAIKSFRHLCSYDSQESIDNVLIELYKRSGRIEEEIEMLQNKLKNIEEGTAFGGKRTKIARSQGKRVHITIEQEKARILGNLAWAYLQEKNYGIAEQHYRKALFLEPDKNKQCNLAICLLHLNRIAEAKSLLHKIRDLSENKPMDESYSKSYERAYQILTEMESHLGLEPILPESDKGKDIPRPFASRIDRNLKEANSSTAQRICVSPVLFTQPRPCSSGFSYGDQRRGGWGKEGISSSIRKLNFEPTIAAENVPLHSIPILNGEQQDATYDKSEFQQQNCAAALPLPTREDWRRRPRRVTAEVNGGGARSLPQPLMNGELKRNDEYAKLEDEGQEEISRVLFTQPRNIHSGGKWGEDAVRSSVRKLSFDGEGMASTNMKSGRNTLQELEPALNKKSWADMVEEEEEEFNDENLDSNIFCQSPSQNQIENLSQKVASFHMKGGQHASGKAVSCGRRRLQVFRDITLLSESP